MSLSEPSSTLAAAIRNPVEFRDLPRRKSQGRSFEILVQMMDRRCARNQQDVGSALKESRQRDLHRCRTQGSRGRGQCRRLQRSKPSQRKEWHVRDVLPREFISR